MDGLLQHMKAILEIHFPERLAKLGERVASPDIVHQNVEVFVTPLNLRDKLFHSVGTV
jgi:hypothetical protein